MLKLPKWRFGSAMVASTAAAAVFAGCAKEAQPLVYDSVAAESDTVLPPIPSLDFDSVPIGTLDLDPGGPGSATAGSGTDVDVTSGDSPADATTGVPTTEAPLTGPGERIGDTWEPATANLAGLASECGNVSLLSVHPTRDQVIAGIALQGLWSSSDGAPTWTHLGEGPGSEEMTHRLADIVYDPEDPDRFWVAGMYTGGGVFATTDGGAVFTRLDPELVHIEGLDVDFSDPERATMVATVHEQPTVMRTTDGGASWEDVSAGLPEDVGVAVAPIVVDADTFVVGTRLGTAAGVYRTDDAGETWTRVYVAPISGAPLRSSDGRLYWLLDNGEGVIASDDDGATWEVVGLSGFWPFGTSIVEVDDGRIAALGATRIVVSVDRGQTWTAVGPPYPFEPTGLAYAPERGAFYLWKFDCNLTGPNDVPEDGIVTVVFAPG